MELRVWKKLPRDVVGFAAESDGALAVGRLVVDGPGNFVVALTGSSALGTTGGTATADGGETANEPFSDAHVLELDNTADRDVVLLADAWGNVVTGGLEGPFMSSGAVAHNINLMVSSRGSACSAGSLEKRKVLAVSTERNGKVVDRLLGSLRDVDCGILIDGIGHGNYWSRLWSRVMTRMASVAMSVPVGRIRRRTRTCCECSSRHVVCRRSGI